MPKRKQVVDSEEEEAFETPSASEDEKPKKSKQKAKATAKKPKLDTDGEDSEEERPLKGKKASKETTRNKATKSSAGLPSDGVQVDSNGDKYIDLGKKKRVTVRSFKGQSYVDVREYWGQEGDEKPGKKGVSMSVEQWETLKSAADTIDVLLSKLKN